MRGAKLDHFARTHKQHLDLGQVFKQITGQAHGGGGHADAVRADLRRGAHLFGHRERALEELGERGAQSACLVSHSHRVFELPQDLRLAQHHAVQATGHAEGMAGGFLVFQAVGVGAQFVGRDAAALGQPGEGMVQRGFIACAVDLGAVAGGDDGRFRGACHALAQPVELRCDLVTGERKPAPHIQRCGGVIDA